MLLLPDVQKQFVQHVKEVYEKDNTLGSGYVSSDLNFRFDGRMVHLEYRWAGPAPRRRSSRQESGRIQPGRTAPAQAPGISRSGK